jgi:hypothetical protein
MNKYFKGYAWINLMGNFDYIKKLVARNILVLFVSIDHVDKGSALFNKVYILRLGIH